MNSVWKHGGVVWFGGGAINLKVGDSRFSPVMAAFPRFNFIRSINLENNSTQVLVAELC